MSITYGTGRSILLSIRQQLQTLSKKKYPNLYKYVGKGSFLHKELITLLNYLINPHKKLNEEGEIEHRFFIAYKEYCFYMDTNSYTQKIRQKENTSQQTRTRSNHALNIFCAIGLFTKDKNPRKYWINQEMKENTNQKRYMTIYHFNKLDLEELEGNAIQLVNAEVTIGNITYNKLMGAGLTDIAKRTYPFNKELGYLRKLSELPVLLTTIEELIKEKGYCTKAELLTAVPLDLEEAKKILCDFRQDIEYNYRYGAPRKQDIEKYNYHYTKWIYTQREQ